MTIDKLPQVIGLIGRMYAGKTTAAAYLAKYGYKRLAFGDALKEMLIAAGMCTRDECYAAKTEHSRWLMQKVGTEIFRRQVHPDFWVQRTAARLLKILAAGGRVVIDDIRFPNEARLVRAYLDKGLLVKLVRVNADGTPWSSGEGDACRHESEIAVDAIQADHTVCSNSGDVDHIYTCIDNILATREAAK